jgi:hypothetical protein
MYTDPYDKADVEITDSGDLVISDTGDIDLASITRVFQQDAIISLYTPYGDFAAYPGWGSTIYRFIGEPNTRNNANLLKSEMLRALGSSNRFYGNSIKIDVIPIGIDQVMANLFIGSGLGGSPISLTFIFNYIAGLQVTA